MRFYLCFPASISAKNHHSKQLAFILNLEQHWFTLRRFGLTSVGEDAGQGHWFNLNSFLTAPEWVGKLYLGMVLQQAEAEGGYVLEHRWTFNE